MKRLFTISVLLLVLVALTACQTMQMRTAKLAIRDEDNPEKALDYLDQELKINPGNADAYLFKAQILGQYKNDMAGSYTNAQKALELDPTKENDVIQINQTVWATSHNNGIRNFNNKEYAKSLENFRLAHMVAPDSLVSTKMLANVYAKMDSIDQAEAIFVSIAEKIPNDTGARAKLAEISFAKNDYKKAIAYYEELHTIEPEKSDHLINISVCYGRLKDTENMLKYQKRAVELEPENTTLLYSIADNAFNNQDFPTATNFYARIISLDETQLDAIKYICYAYSNLKDYMNLKKYAEKWVTLEPKNTDANMLLSLAKQQLGE